VVYVDSGSSDASPAIAAGLGVGVLELDRSRPFSAARARNAGFEELADRYPGLRYVQFLDGDCTLEEGWLARAAQALDDVPECSAVLGHLHERDEHASVYNRLCAMEWRSETGDLNEYGSLGGIAMVRVDVFRALRGFREDVIAGEDSELGVRMALAGHRVTRLDACMATHDAAITRFGQWWRRAVRAGHAIGQRADLNGRTVARDCVHERRSTLFWGMGLPLLLATTLLPTQGASLLLLLGYPVLLARVALRRRRAGAPVRDALLYGFFIVVAKFANAVGLLRFFVNKAAGRYRIIEYK